MTNNSQSEVKPNVGMLRQWLNEDRITDPKKMVTNEDLEYWLKVAEPKLPQSEVKCCIGNCPKTCKIHGGWFVFCDNWGCLCHRRHHPKESPVSQSVEGWEEIGIGEPALNHLADIIIDDKSERSQRIRKIKHAIRGILSSTLSTLVKEMEKLETKADSYEGTDGAFAFKQCISAAVEVIKKMGV